MNLAEAFGHPTQSPHNPGSRADFTLYKSCPSFKGSRPPLFVTGGVGGVHRGGESSLDVSADLVELGRSRVPVVSAGVKSILDIGRTLEFLVRIFIE